MRKFLLTALFSTAAFMVWAQDSSKSTKNLKPKTAVKGTWDKGGMLSLTVAQGGTRNWAPGGDRFTLAGNGFLNLYAKNTRKKSHWDNMLDVSYGLINSRVTGIVKNDDKFDFITRWTHELGVKKTSKFRYGALLNFRTQFVDGYDYDDESSKKRISSFLAPGILAVSPGVQFFSKDNSLNVHFGGLGRWVIVANRPYELAANYGVKPDREVRIEAGAMASVGYNKEIFKNIIWRTRADVFSDFLHDAPTSPDVFWTNMLYFKVNKCIGFVYNFDLQYDDNTRIFGYSKDRPGTQLKSILGVGLSVKL